MPPHAAAGTHVTIDARLATREAIHPLYVTTDVLSRHWPPLRSSSAFAPTPTTSPACDSLARTRPFLTANDGMWKAFEPELRRRLADLRGSATLRERVRAVLAESLPSGQASMDAVAHTLAPSKRTLQRGLSNEGASFEKVLRDTRQALARHYLKRTRIATVEISYLLSYAEPNSFYRAFGQWTGTTPEAVRHGAMWLAASDWGVALV